MTDSTIRMPVAAEHPLVGPPGVLFYIATIVAILLALDTNTRQSIDMLVLTIPIWLVVAGAWLFRFVMALFATRGRMSVAHWARWLAIPVALGLVVAVTRTDGPLRTRFDFSRGAFDELAADFVAGAPLRHGWIGLYPIEAAERTANGFLAVVDDYGLGRWGFAYSPDGRPIESDENFLGGWQGAEFE